MLRLSRLVGHSSLRRVVGPTRALQRCPNHRIWHTASRLYSTRRVSGQVDKSIQNTGRREETEDGKPFYTVMHSNKPGTEVAETRAQTLDSFIDEMNLEANIATARKFRGQDRVAFAELLGRLEDEPDNMYWLYHLAELYRSHGVNVKTVIPEPPPGSPPYIPDPRYITKADEAVQELTETEDGELVQTQYDKYPDLMTPDPLMDSRDIQEFPPDDENPFHNKVVVRNHYSMFHEAMELDGFEFNEKWKPAKTDLTEDELTLNELAGFRNGYDVSKLFVFPLVRRWTTQQTEKGKISQMQVFMVVGDGNGTVGLGMGKDENGQRAYDKALIKALKNMDFVDRFEQRTIWTNMETKFGATKLVMRPRPVGFGLRCAPVLHQVLKAAGIKDISAKIWGSRNPIVVMQAALRMLQGGHSPLAMGDGLGGKGRKLNKGIGMRSKADVERERGRRLVSLRV